MTINKNAFTVDISPNGNVTDEHSSVNQSSPAWLLTFIRWENRDTLRIGSIDFSSVRSDDPLVVQNDCIALTVITNKGSLTPSMTATLMSTDVNYMAAVAPGDFVIVNMFSWETDSVELAKRANAGQPINREKDGFKGLFKVQSVRKSITVSPDTGTKTVTFQIDGYGFTEFNNTIYFNPNLLVKGDAENLLLFARNLSVDWANLVTSGYLNVQDVLAILIQSFIGTGINTENLTDDFKSHLPTANTHFYIPKLVGRLLGIPEAIAAKDIYTYLFGIQKYAPKASSLSAGLNPFMSSANANLGPGFRYTHKKCAGETVFKPEFWNSAKAWSIMQQYLNSPLNEIYTCFRLSTNGHVLPTVVFRQIPFTSQEFEKRTKINVEVTKFLNLPRWRISAALIYSFDIGRDEAARVNFMQYYSRVGGSDGGAGASMETSADNFEYDKEDVKRSGLRPSIVSNFFDPIGSNGTDNALAVRSPIWAKIVGDAVIGGHLKLNGTIECMGIEQPISIGDNLEFDGVVFHIESVVHSCGIDGVRGIKRFRTILKLSSGVNAESHSSTAYGEMQNTNAYKDREANEGILPGVAESQDTLKRDGDLDKASKTNKPFTQPE